jgi:hypothetical protein
MIGRAGFRTLGKPMSAAGGAPSLLGRADEVIE